VGGGIDDVVTRTVAKSLPLRVPDRLMSEKPVCSLLP
jgi:hypothetical protein